MDQSDRLQGSISRKRKERIEDLEGKGLNKSLIAMEHESCMKDSGDFTPIDIGESKKQRHTRKTKANLKTQDGLENCTRDDRVWVESLSATQLDIMVNIKQLAMERMISTTEKSLEGILPATALRAIGLIVEGLIQERMEKMLPSLQNGLPRQCDRTGTSPSGVSVQNCLASLSSQ